MNEEEINLITGALDSLGVALADHGHEWTEGEHAIYEAAVECVKRANTLQSRLAASRGSAPEAALRVEIKHLKGELAYMKLQRDRLLEITWLDGPAEPWESTQAWQEQFNKGWVRRAEVSQAQN